jgi:RNA polymerase sigma-70 factor (ECF subfamily)
MEIVEKELHACLPALRAFARTLTRNRADADDLVQDTVVRILKSAEKFQPGTNFRAWAFTILRNRFLNEFVAKRRMTRELSEGDLERVSTRARQEERLVMADFRRIFFKLPQDHRTILSLVIGSGLPYEEVAKVLGCAEGTVKSRIHRARAALRALMDEAMATDSPRQRFYRAGASERALLHSLAGGKDKLAARRVVGKRADSKPAGDGALWL